MTQPYKFYSHLYSIYVYIKKYMCTLKNKVACSGKWFLKKPVICVEGFTNPIVNLKAILPASFCILVEKWRDSSLETNSL